VIKEGQMLPLPRYAVTLLAASSVIFLTGLSIDVSGQTAHPHRDGTGAVTLALAGDAILSRELSVYEEPEFLRLRELIQTSTAAFVNLEILFHNFEADVIPAATSGGTYMQADPRIAHELVWMGFDGVSRANNHTGDYGYGGILHTDQSVEAAGLVHAGTGDNLARARAPAYLETARGRVALISAASTFADPMRAGRQWRDVRGRPGLNPIRYQTVYQVTQEQMDALRAFREDQGYGSEPAQRLRMFGETFQVGGEYKVLTRPHEGDLAELVASVEEAKRQADFVVFSSHSHERGASNQEPADFIITLAHAVVDAGADVFFAHGPHVLRGIEIYRGKPIFYSLGDFAFQPETVPFQPGDNYERYELPPDAVAPDFFDARQRSGGFPANALVWEGVVARVRFLSGELDRVELHPVTLGHGLPRPQRGRPLLATGPLAEKIIGDLERLSEPFGTRIESQGGVGVVRVR
jgi:poly-gamma-glutamate synthesis protein (capsule biosynthesis protein)